MAAQRRRRHAMGADREFLVGREHDDAGAAPESLSPRLVGLPAKSAPSPGGSDNNACNTDSARSVTPSGSLASVSARNSRHLCTTVSDAPGLAAKFSVAAWLATMASDNGRRPKGVVEKFRSMPLLSCFGQSRNARRIGAPTLTREIGEAYSYLRQKNTKALELVRRLGAFLFAARLFPSDSFRGGSELPADRRADR